MEVAIVKFFQDLANGFFDAFFWCITKLGEETVFLMVLAFVYVCYSKKFAVKLSMYYLVSVGFNSVMKLIVRRPRPYIASTEIVDRLHANGYSFPSGHTQGYFAMATTNFIEINNSSKNKKFKISSLIILLILGILVMISRMYWGQHYLSDVIVGMMFGICIPYFLEWFFTILPKNLKSKFTTDRWFAFLGIMSLILFITMLILELSIGFYSRKVYKFVGVFLAMSIGYFVDKKFINYNENEGLKFGIVKLIITGIVLVGLYLLIDLIIPINSYIYFIVYLFLGLICSIILPILFKFLFQKRTRNE